MVSGKVTRLVRSQSFYGIWLVWWSSTDLPTCVESKTSFIILWIVWWRVRKTRQGW